MEQFEIIAAGERNGQFDAIVDLLQRAGIPAQQMLIAEYDRLTGYDPELHPRGAEVYVLVPVNKLTEALELLKSHSVDSLNSLARRVWTTLIAAYPECSKYFGTRGKDDLEAAVPAPIGSKAGHLVVFTAEGQDLWVRFSSPWMCYSVSDETELLGVIQQLLAETAFFAAVMRGDEWTGTTLIRQGEPGDLPQLGPNQVAHVVSWYGKYDRIIKADKSE
jgi:hypothetical protein